MLNMNITFLNDLTVFLQCMFNKQLYVLSEQATNRYR